MSLRRPLEVSPVACEACPVGRAWGVGAGGACPLVTHPFDAGEVVARAGEPADRIWFVRDGVVATGDRDQLSLRLPGSVVGAEGLYRGRYVLDSRALTPVRACSAPAEVIRSWLRR